jgi:hypothetical protein
MRPQSLPPAMVTLTMLLVAAPVLAQPQTVDAAASAAAAPASRAAPARGGAPRPYQAPIQVPSAAGQIRVPTLPPPAISVTPAPRPTFTGNCDSSGCWDSDGTRINAVGGALVRPDGRMCQDVGGVLQCP